MTSSSSPEGRRHNAASHHDGIGKRFNFGFLIGNFWPVPLNKTHIVGTSIQAQLPEPSYIKDLIRGRSNPVCPLLIKAFHAWMFRQLRHECSPFSADLWSFRR